LRASLFDYDLPAELIAQHPSPEREGARLLVVGERLDHRTVGELDRILSDRSLVVVNDTRVRRARLIGKKASGGRVEVFLLGPNPSGTWRAMGRASKPFKFPSEIVIVDEEDEATPLVARLLRRHADGCLEIELIAPGMSVDEAIERHGRMPLPPYIRRMPDSSDETRYQTVYARKIGAVAAPTAGLHLSEALLDRMRARGHAIESVTLHVGLGTFQPVTAEDLDDHPMHAETYEIPDRTWEAIVTAKRQERPIVAVGTTVVRALETAAMTDRRQGETRLLIQPGFCFRVVDMLLTNFHLPRSTLLALVCAFGGRERILSAYQEAVRERYRFFSYGDAMLITR
jgi:S-adenosylmethionine:tRNA ribosyltransferase-isomerase